MEDRLHIAVGVVYNQQGDKVLIARRPAHVHQGDLWEFPGGKLACGETAEQALARELYEELGLVVEYTTPLICFDYDYPQQKVKLDVWVVEQWSGEIIGKEGQEIAWVTYESLNDYEFPTANQQIISAIT